MTYPTALQTAGTTDVDNPEVAQIVNALQAKVGITGSLDVNSLDYKTAHAINAVATFVADLTDSSGGVAVDTLVPVRSDTAAHTAADANANFASIAEQLADLTAAFIAAGQMAAS